MKLLPHNRQTSYATFNSIFFFKQKTAYEISLGLVGSGMCKRQDYRGIYGSESMESCLRQLREAYGDRAAIEYYQSNHEGDIIDTLHP